VIGESSTGEKRPRPKWVWPGPQKKTPGKESKRTEGKNRPGVEKTFTKSFGNKGKRRGEGSS